MKRCGRGEGNSKQAAAKEAARHALHPWVLNKPLSCKELICMPSRLKSLELHGYKTFASRTLFEFAENITAYCRAEWLGQIEYRR